MAFDYAHDEVRRHFQRLIEEQLRNAGGVVAEKLAKSIAYRWNKENSERSKSERFRIKLKLRLMVNLSKLPDQKGH